MEGESRLPLALAAPNKVKKTRGHMVEAMLDLGSIETVKSRHNASSVVIRSVFVV